MLASTLQRRLNRSRGSASVRRRAGRHLDGFVGDVAPLAIGAKTIAPGLVFLSQLALTAVAIDDDDAI